MFRFSIKRANKIIRIYTKAKAHACALLNYDLEEGDYVDALHFAKEEHYKTFITTHPRFAASKVDVIACPTEICSCGLELPYKNVVVEERVIVLPSSFNTPIWFKRPDLIFGWGRKVVHQCGALVSALSIRYKSEVIAFPSNSEKLLNMDIMIRNRLKVTNMLPAIRDPNLYNKGTRISEPLHVSNFINYNIIENDNIIEFIKS